MSRRRETPESHEISRSQPSHPTTNGRSALGPHHKDGSRATASSVNGVKSHHEEGHTTERNGKASLPPLLSPLRLTLDEEHDGAGAAAAAAAAASAKSPRKRPPDSGDGHARPPVKLQKGTQGAATPTKRKSPLRVPPLLSPTLPKIVEDELELLGLKSTPPKGGDSSQWASQASESPSSARKIRAAADSPVDEQKKSLMVTLKYKKRNAKRVLRLLALQPASLKEALRKERSASIDGTPPPARKRPTAADSPSYSPSNKRAKTTSDKSLTTAPEKTITARPAAPSTPLKTTAMSRAASNSQAAHTPGESTGLTPGAAERPPTSHGESAGGSSTGLYQRFERYKNLGAKLKHDRDAIIRPATEAARGDAASQLPTSQKKLVAALSLEMVMSYMAAFRLLNQARNMDRKPAHFGVWDDLMPHLQELRKTTREFRVLEGLALQLRAVCLEQLVNALTTHDAATIGTRLVSATRKRADAWMEAFHLVESVADGAMRVDIGPWHSIEDVLRNTLPVLRRWTEREGVDWEQEMSLPSNGA